MHRAYFNRAREAPQIWSVDEGEQSTESNVIAFVVHTEAGRITSNWDPKIKPNPDQPTAWMVIEGYELKLEHGVAHFYPVKPVFPGDGKP